jgi:opacity protein-like surface antigen
MIHRWIWVTVAASILWGSSALAQLQAGEMTVSIDAGAVGLTGTDVEEYKLGYGFGGSVRYGLVPGVSLALGINYGSSQRDKVGEGLATDDGQSSQPVPLKDEGEMKRLLISFSGIYDMSPLIGEHVVMPYLTGGIEACRWEHRDADGDLVVIDGNEAKDIVMGVHMGTGVDWTFTRSLSVGLSYVYHYLFSSDTDRFGMLDHDEKLWKINGSLAYHFALPLQLF